MSSQPEQPDDPLIAGDAGQKVIRGSSLRVAAHVTGLVAGVVSAPLVVRHLGLEDYGRYVLVSSIVFVATGLTEGGLANVAIRQYTTSAPAERRALMSALLGLRLVLGLLGALGMLVFGLVAGYPDVVLGGLALGGLALLLNGTWGTFHTALVADLRLGSVAVTEIARSLVTTAVLVGLVVGGASLGLFYLAVPVAAAVTVVVSAVLVRRTLSLVPRFDLARWRTLLKETALYALATALGAVYFQIALITTSLLTDERETGVFGVAFRIVELANGIPWLVAGSVFPVLAHAAANDVARLRYAVDRVTHAGMIAGGLFAIGIVLGAPFALEVVAGDEGEPAVGVLRILGLGVMATFLVAAWGFVLLSRQQYGLLLRANAAAFVLAIVASLLVIPHFGAEGSAAVTAGLELTLAGLYGTLLWRQLPGLDLGRQLAVRLLAALALAFAVGVPLLAVGSVPATVAGVLVYLAVLWRTDAVPQELIDAIPRRRS